MIRKYIKKIKETDLIKNIAILASGAVIGYMINMLLLPIVGRIYTPDRKSVV